MNTHDCNTPEENAAYDNLYKYARKKNESLQANEFIYLITWETIDGTYFRCPQALVEDKSNWIIIYTEHHNFFILHKDETVLVTRDKKEWYINDTLE